MKKNEEWQEAAAKRGVENFDLAIVGPWSVGYHLIPEDLDRDRRMAHAMSWIRTSEEDNGYARPLDGLHVWVDLDEMEVIKVLDRGTKVNDVVNDLEDAKYREEDRDLRTDLTPYNVEQPEGPSWKIEGRKSNGKIGIFVSAGVSGKGSSSITSATRTMARSGVSFTGPRQRK